MCYGEKGRSEGFVAKQSTTYGLFFCRILRILEEEAFLDSCYTGSVVSRPGDYEIVGRIMPLEFHEG